jgi:hypothetical protein
MRQLTGPELRRLTEAMVEAFPNESDLEQMVDYADFTPRKSLARIAPPGKLDSRVRELIKSAEAEGWLLSLVEEAWKANRTPSLQAFRDTLKPLVVAGPVNHYKVCFMDNRPLVDRDGLRSATELLATARRRIVIVNGEPVSGKSYSLQYIRYLREQLQNFALVWVDLEVLSKRTGGGMVLPSTVAERIVEQMNLDPATLPEKGEETWAAWVTAFCDRLTGRLQRSTEPCWIVLDGFHRVPLPQETMDLVKELATRVCVNISTLRLVLLSYADILPSDVEPDVERETISPISSAELSRFFTQVYEGRGAPFTAADVAQVVARVLRQIDPNHPRRLELLGREVVKASRDILTQGVGP